MVSATASENKPEVSIEVPEKEPPQLSFFPLVPHLDNNQSRFEPLKPQLDNNQPKFDSLLSLFVEPAVNEEQPSARNVLDFHDDSFSVLDFNDLLSL